MTGRQGSSSAKRGLVEKEIPYSQINPQELKDIEAEFGHALTPELAQCMIRYRINRGAIDLMLRKGAGAEPAGSADSSSAGEISVPESEDSNEGPKSEEDDLPSSQPAGRRKTRRAVA